ncbi:hypothetical protein N7492_009765 [Penicillium capsulatum]|uniref:Uncharacterized protein n=1 Tax=Penicillium capsulatum TaxID=69766 RepID=A0A9W9HPT9_9EURO|nr:hypothetical protein N7492_009765 [Penicillium capsulatum]KAJ6114153.1 hypothetical protein N7512_007598 [Penicillium capsulatum]
MRFFLVTLIAAYLSIALSTPTSNNTVYRRDDSYEEVEEISSKVTGLKLAWKDPKFKPFMITWDQHTDDITRAKSYSTSGGGATLIMVTGSKVSWFCPVKASLRNKINKPNSGANAASVKKSKLFKDYFTYAYLGKEVLDPENLPKNEKGEVIPMVDTPLSKFQEYLKDNDGQAVSIVIISPTKPKKENEVENQALIYAMAWQIRQELGNDLPMTWVPSQERQPKAEYYWFGWRRIRQDSIPSYGSPGQLIEAYYGARKCVEAAFPDRPIHVDDYHLTSTDDLKLVSIPAEIEQEGSINLADELYSLWDQDGLDPLMDCDQKINTPRTATTPSDDFIIKHNNKEHPAIIVTILSEAWSYSLFIPLSSDILAKKYKSVDEFNKDEDFRNLRADYLDKYPGFLLNSDDRPTKLLDILAVIRSSNPYHWSYSPFTKAIIGMVAASAQEKGLDLSAWSGDVHVFNNGILGGDYRFVIADLRKEQLTLGEPGHAFYFYLSANDRVLWEFGKSGRVTHEYSNPRGYMKTMKLDYIVKE